MRKRTFQSILAVLSVGILCAVLCLSPAMTHSADSVGFETVETVITPAEDATDNVKTEAVPEPALPEVEVEDEPVEREFTEDELKIRFTNMLNLNYCYNGNFRNPEMLAVCSAISLDDYAADIPGYGIGVGRHLVTGFAESFYGVVLNFDEITFEDEVEGYVMSPQYSVGTQSHTVVSITETEDGYEVLSTLNIYYGGDDTEFCIVNSVFKKAPSSEFGFNLISAELS